MSVELAAATLAVDSRCTHGEGVLWCEKRQSLLWVDISERKLWQHHPESGVTRHWALPDRPGCIGLFDDGTVLVALVSSLHRADLAAATDETLPLQWLADVQPHNAYTRSNDGRADRDGNFVFGTMNEHPARAPDGRFFQYSSRHGLRELPLPGIVIPNAISFSLDGRTMYWCDSVSPRIMACDYDAAAATTGNVRVFATLANTAAEPDGSAVDAAGRVWNAQWRARQVSCYDAGGALLQVQPVPVKNPTCVAFGGPDLRTLYIISSRLDHTPEELAASAHAGSLFSARQAAPGLPESRVRAA
ncbi:MAG: SMP-30/gluconolactonase/LRE family protein [Stenotrophomonas chelatiphaga]